MGEHDRLVGIASLGDMAFPGIAQPAGKHERTGMVVARGKK